MKKPEIINRSGFQPRSLVVYIRDGNPPNFLDLIGILMKIRKKNADSGLWIADSRKIKGVLSTTTKRFSKEKQYNTVILLLVLCL